ncbi:TetR-like C-terminal domain-containing protein [Thomasclavelia sp.]|uniref:TetR-like C-terminal domain-containing protein n=1 Tax=Thomasclavelia sp. TaxID=3025757 RepID=UPI0025F1BD68|nr:TetR-like C-terminal domain-containing protein [Thomasclavelia sp.]
MGQDARVRYTKMIIRVNFISLLKQKPINKITVKELCEMAEINRTTFYKYYLDIYDLMDKIEEEILEELHETMRSSILDGIDKTLIKVLEKMKENGSLYITLFSENGDTKFPLKIFQMCYAEFSTYINEQFPHLSKTKQALIYVYTAQGSSGILDYWINDGMQESPKEIASFITQLITNTLKSSIS